MYRDYYRAHALDTTKLFPGVAETLADLTSRGIRCAVATIKSTETSRRVLERFGIARYFQRIQGIEEGIPFKPDPGIVLRILDVTGWEKRETGIVGDTDYDILAGQRAGIRTCAVTYGACPRAVFLPLKPDRIIDEFSELRVFC
jgi:phosphoglycolate phosphatase